VRDHVFSALLIDSEGTFKQKGGTDDKEGGKLEHKVYETGVSEKRRFVITVGTARRIII